MTWQKLAGGLSGALSVGLGAYGAHGMMGKAENFKTSFETGVRYQMVHSALLVATPAICGSNIRAANIAGLCFTAGILLFSGMYFFFNLYLNVQSSPSVDLCQMISCNS